VTTPSATPVTAPRTGRSGRALNKRFALVGGALLALGAGGGVAAAQSVETAAVACGAAPARPVSGMATLSVSTADFEARQQKLNQALASKLGISVERLTQATAEARKEAGLPEGGSVTAVALPPEKVFTLALGGDPLSAAARPLNLSVEQLREELKAKSLTELARARGVDPAAVAAALKDDERARIDAAVAKGGLPPEVVEGLRAGVDARVEQLLAVRFAAQGDFAVACGGTAVPRPAR
jgi:hypothetical protein